MKISLEFCHTGTLVFITSIKVFSIVLVGKRLHRCDIVFTSFLAYSIYLDIRSYGPQTSVLKGAYSDIKVSVVCKMLLIADALVSGHARSLGHLFCGSRAPFLKTSVSHVCNIYRLLDQSKAFHMDTLYFA